MILAVVGLDVLDNLGDEAAVYSVLTDVADVAVMVPQLCVQCGCS